MLCVARPQPFWSDLDVSCGVRHLQRGLTRLPLVVIPPTRPHHTVLHHGMVLPLTACAVGCGGVPWRLEALFSGCRRGGGPASRSCLDPPCGGWAAPEVYENLVAAAASGGLATLLRLHFEHPPFPVESIWYMAPATSLESDDFSEGRMLSCLMDAWVSLGHFFGAREPTVLRLACQYVLALHPTTNSQARGPRTRVGRLPW